MGNSQSQKSFLNKGEGLRIIDLAPNSPLDGQVSIFFDFIIGIEPTIHEKSASQILDKLSGENVVVNHKPFKQILAQNENKAIKLKIVSTKYRNVRTIEVTPNRNWNGSNDLLGILLRIERFDEAFDTYCPIVDIVNNSPVKKAGIREGLFMLGCQQFQFNSINSLIEGLYDRFFDKEVKEKHVHFALYDILTDQVLLKSILLKRGWGGKGLLGCQFLQGALNKFPTNLQEQRKHLLQKENIKNEKLKLKNQLGQCDGASKSLVEALKNQKNRKHKHLKNLQNLLSIKPPEIPKRSWIDQGEHEKVEKNKNDLEDNSQRIQILERKVTFLEETLQSVREYLGKIDFHELSQEES